MNLVEMFNNSLLVSVELCNTRVKREVSLVQVYAGGSLLPSQDGPGPMWSHCHPPPLCRPHLHPLLPSSLSLLL